MLKNRTIHFVDFIWKEGGKEWERVFKAEVFNHLLPQKPLIDMVKEKSNALNVDNIETFLEETKPPIVKEVQEKVKGESSSRRTILSTPPKVVEEPTRIVSFIADAIVHDNLKVYHAVVYGISEKAVYIACKTKHLPVKRKLQLIISSKELKEICTMTGEISAVSKFSPIGYAISVNSMPSDLMKIAKT